MKSVLNHILAHATKSGITVTYPDGQTIAYGKEAKKLHLEIKNTKTLRRLATQPSIGLGEGYMRGDIVFKKGGFDELMHFLNQNYKALNAWTESPLALLTLAKNVRRRQQSYIAHHYDIGNDFYRLWLDKSMAYSCAYFKKRSDSLETAQKQKVNHILRKLNLEKNHTLLDIGCGWGTLLITAAGDYGVRGHGITLSEEQLTHAQAAAKEAGVDHLVKFELANYQDLPARGKQYDRIVSVGMFEHVGRKNLPVYFDVVSQLLKPSGVSVLHSITTTRERGTTDPWMDKYIFPGGYIPAVREIFDLLPKYEFHPIDYENLRLHYALTLDEWRRRFEKHREKIIARYGEEFYRMWQMYLATCAGNFRYNGMDLSQVIFVKGYDNELPLTREYLYQ